MQQDIPQKYSKVFSRNIESNGRFSGCYRFIIEGDFGKKAESSIYYKIGLDIDKILTGFEVGDTIIFSVKNEFDFWKRVKLKAYSSNHDELFCFRWIMGNEVLRKGVFKESCLSEDGKIEAIELAKIKKLDILPEQKRTIVIFDKICRTPSSYNARPLVGNLLNELEFILINRFLERKYAAPFFIINLQEVIKASHPVFQNTSHVRDFYLKRGYTNCDNSLDFLEKDTVISLKCGQKNGDANADNEEDRFYEILEKKGGAKLNDSCPNFFQECELFEWGDAIEVIDNGRDFLCSAISNEERKLLKLGMRGLVLSTEKKEDCGMITCGFREIESLYIKIHFSNLRKISKFN